MPQQPSPLENGISKKINWTTILTLLGVIAAWVPLTIDSCTPVKIKGKLISIYANIGEFNNEPRSIFLFKISTVSLNHSFPLEDISINIKYLNNDWTYNSSVNQRVTHFTFDNIPKKLNLPESSFLNNLSILKKDDPIVGYLLTTTPVFPKDSISEIEFVFKSYNGKTRNLHFEISKINDLKMHFDDSIWGPADSSVLEKFNARNKNL